MNSGVRQSSLGGDVGRCVVGDDRSLGAFYRSEARHERIREGMHLTAMVGGKGREHDSRWREVESVMQRRRGR
jgi:hypothetical protein